MARLSSIVLLLATLAAVSACSTVETPAAFPCGSQPYHTSCAP